MKVFIDENTTKELKETLAKKTDEYAVRIYVSSFRCGGPTLSISLYRKKEGDEILNINGIDVFVDEGVSEFANELEISNGGETFGSNFTVKIIGSSPTC